MLDHKELHSDSSTEEKKIDISYDDLLMVASGITEDGKPASIATAVLDKLNESGEQVADMQAILQEAVIYLYHSGGCTVLQAEFQKNSLYTFSRVVDLLSTYSENSADPEYLKNHGMGIVIVPMALYGQISIVFQDMVYFTGFDLPDMGKRLVICFNDLATEVMHAGEDIDYEEIVQTVKAEAQRELDRVNQEIQEVEAELEQVEKENLYQQMVENRYGRDNYRTDDEDNENEEEQGHSWMRISKE